MMIMMMMTMMLVLMMVMMMTMMTMMIMMMMTFMMMMTMMMMMMLELTPPGQTVPGAPPEGPSADLKPSLGVWTLGTRTVTPSPVINLSIDY